MMTLLIEFSPYLASYLALYTLIHLEYGQLLGYQSLFTKRYGSMQVMDDG